jgi:hypothetical protein
MFKSLEARGIARRELARRKTLASIRRGAGGSTHREMQLLAALGAATLFTTGSTSKGGAPWTDVLEIAEGLDDTEYRLRALSGLWAYAVGNADLPAAVAFAQRIANLAPNHAGPTDRLVASVCLEPHCTTWGIRATRDVISRTCSVAMRQPRRSRISISSVFTMTRWLQTGHSRADSLASGVSRSGHAYGPGQC